MIDVVGMSVGRPPLNGLPHHRPELWTVNSASALGRWCCQATTADSRKDALMVHTATPRRRKRKPLIPEFFDPQSRELVQGIFAGDVPLVEVNKPGVSRNVLAFFQDPANERLIARPPRPDGFDVVVNQVAVERRRVTPSANLARSLGLETIGAGVQRGRCHVLLP